MRTPTVLSSDIYAVAGLAGAGLAALALTCGAPRGLSFAPEIGLCFFLRMMAIHYGWRLPDAGGPEKSRLMSPGDAIVAISRMVSIISCDDATPASMRHCPLPQSNPFRKGSADETELPNSDLDALRNLDGTKPPGCPSPKSRFSSAAMRMRAEA